MVKLLFLRWTKLLVDGTVVNGSAAGSTTGGFYPENQRWEPAALVKLKQGEHTMRIESESVFPHIDRILLSPRGNAARKVGWTCTLLC
jgi:hypothetical protein